MPHCIIRNGTAHTLNIALSQVAPLYWENEVSPGTSVDFKTGPVWFTIIARVDGGADSGSRFTVGKSVLKIGAFSLGVVAVAGAGVAAVAYHATTSAVAAAGSSAVAAKKATDTSSKASTVAKTGGAAAGTVIILAGTAIRVTWKIVCDKLMEMLEEFGSIAPQLLAVVNELVAASAYGNLMTEVLKIFCSPTVRQDLANGVKAILVRLARAFLADRARCRWEGPVPEEACKDAELSAAELSALLGEIVNIAAVFGRSEPARNKAEALAIDALRKHEMRMRKTRRFVIELSNGQLVLREETGKSEGKSGGQDGEKGTAGAESK